MNTTIEYIGFKLVKIYSLQCSVNLLVTKPFIFCCNTNIKKTQNTYKRGPGGQSSTLGLKFRGWLSTAPWVPTPNLQLPGPLSNTMWDHMSSCQMVSHSLVIAKIAFSDAA